MFDPKATYKVTKIKVDREGSDRYVQAGDVFTGEIVRLEIGQSMVLAMDNFGELVTSKVEKIEPANGENLLVGTRNSTYSLEKINE